MIRTVAKPLFSKLAELPFYDKFGGIAKRISIQRDENVIETIPVSCLDGEDCSEDQYYDLCPDESKKSVMYFEDIGGMTYAGPGIHGSKYYEFLLRFVGWFNLNLIGLTDCNLGAQLTPLIMEKLESNKPTFNATIVKQEPINFNPFQDYSFFHDQRLTFFPFETIVLNVKIKAMIKCHTTPNYSPVECP